MDEELQQLIKLKVLSKPPEVTVSTGFVHNKLTGCDNPYKITLGWDLISAYECDKQWTSFRLQIAALLATMSEPDRQKELQMIPNEDGHWKWLDKSALLKKDEYKWFFFKTDNSIEAACLIYHPKKSVSSKKDVFYIEFIAVAPWNRYNPCSEKKHKNIGSILLKEIMKYCTIKLNFEAGMCLHSLPQAKSFYEEKLGMVHFSDEDKGPLYYYEMNDHKFIEFMRA